MLEIIDVNPSNVDRYGFFCLRSKPKSEGYQNKLNWLKKRFNDGLKLKIIQENGRQRGFIEYIPGEYTWRAINAKNYMVVHCLWIVGRNKGKGYGRMLLEECMNDARELNLSGVALVTSEKGWLPSKSFFETKGFEIVDHVSDFELSVLKFTEDANPSFYNWEEKAKEYTNGITVFKADQCPFIQNAINNITDAAEELDIEVNSIKLDTYELAQQNSPTPFGVFTVIYKGEIITYHPLTKNNFIKLLTKKVGV